MHFDAQSYLFKNFKSINDTNETIKVFWKMYWWLGTSLIKQNLTYKLTCKSLVDITSFYLNFNIKESAALWMEREQLESLVSMHPSLHPASMWESSLAHFVILSSIQSSIIAPIFNVRRIQSFIMSQIRQIRSIFGG